MDRKLMSRPPERPVLFHEQMRPGLPQKTVQLKRTPVAPPVYRPHSAQKALQPKTVGQPKVTSTPKPPPVYRPQQMPRCVQTKSVAGPVVPHLVAKSGRRPEAPPVYRPQTVPGVLQPKAGITQPNMGQLHRPAPAPPVYRPDRRMLPAQNVVVQRQKWKVTERGRKGNKFLALEPYGGWWNSRKAPTFILYKPGNTQGSLEGTNVMPAGLQKGDIWNDYNNAVTKASQIAAERKKQLQQRGAKRKRENEEKLQYEQGKTGYSPRLKEKHEKKFKEKIEALKSDPGKLHYTRGDSDDEGLDAQELKKLVQEGIDKKGEKQILAMDSGISNPSWDDVPEPVKKKIKLVKEAVEKQKVPEIIHITNEDELEKKLPESELRPLYSGARLVLRAQPHNKQILKSAPNTGKGTTLDDLSHSINRGQLPDELQHSDIGGANHPLNIPYENYITNQVVNTSIEKVAERFLMEGRKVLKVTHRIWSGETDRVLKSIHVLYVEGLAHPLVFGTEDLGDSKPTKHIHRL